MLFRLERDPIKRRMATMPDEKKPETDTEDPGKDKTSELKKPKEIGGPKGLEPTRYGDWERKGIVSDF
jgi:hypothetical protein